MRQSTLRLILTSVLLFSLAGPGRLAPARAAAPPSPAARVTQLIVKYAGPAPAALTPQAVADLSAAAGVSLSYLRPMLLPGAQVLRLPQPVSETEAQTLAAQLAAQPGVEFAVPDYVRHTLAVPNDYFLQFPNASWNLLNSSGSINAPAAWDVVTDTSQIVVAVLDSGILTDHIELPASRLLSGYDFVTDVFMANDGDARDANPADPGDWVAFGDDAKNFNCPALLNPTDVITSTWHGLEVASMIAARGNNTTGSAGVSWGGASILPVRVAGKCGGTDSDIVDGMLWASGLSSSPLFTGTLPGFDPARPAQILNLSLGSAGTCSGTLYERALPSILGQGVLVVAAAGNSLAPVAAPANCPGVIAVAGTDRAGNLSIFNVGGSNHGPEIALSAPGGNFATDPIVVPSNEGITATTVPTYATKLGTSFAAPAVAGVAALVWAANRDLTPARVTEILTATARAFPLTSSCVITYPGECGAGLLDAGAAVNAARPTLVTRSPVSVTAGSGAFTLTITGTQFVEPGLTLPGVHILWNGAALTTTYISATSLTATVPAGLVAGAGVVQLGVANPGAGVGPVITATTTLTFSVAASPATQRFLYLPSLQRGP